MITIKLTELIGFNVAGVTAQVTNPIYLENDVNPRIRVLKNIRTYTENGKQWVELTWEKKGNSMEPDCGFTGCTIARNSCAIQLEESDYLKLKKS